ncbi:sodium:proton antiporter [Petrotoga sp. HWH.PT.55.6.1]|uniref:Sodium:proton antiporter n=1 Tax=Petrotoga halophila DSM 16923 TaxID=1122953 RepID=A0A2S5EI72_9BACT|nr:sodium:proton antiporter [Petrotoga sp. 8T1HF07.NaAc.6.1]PNR88225.1 sodium:proton antiporter [Petrotoga sp. 9T1HF07.CasAA.8.2]PNR93459.1 sodium:proton antiporter [Petrotoga sp. HWHPT.55.6.3]POZ92679.1 sodium:proton antiporter [Petrotoga halophila DSM 16923]RLL84629.1 sodium:proton antiporter [Petrotoga sp. Shatin.DS.tank11.9.2.9.3]RLL89580.1 sodium:proton antiporter [Petrotoga sp. HKA.pet.4.5]RPD36320.1 sodium:proton antiporter [Petrotoga sp. HWH.PT.55.6.1]
MEIIAVIIGFTMILFALMAIESKKLLNSIVFLSITSLLSVVEFIIMKAPDVAITQAVIGSGLMTSLFVFTLMTMKKSGEK